MKRLILMLVLMTICLWSLTSFSMTVDKSVTVTGASGASATATAVFTNVGSPPSITNIKISKFATAALSAGTTPIVCTTTNLNDMIFPFSNDAQVQGTIGESIGNFTDALTAPANVDVTVVCPATTNVIWTITIIYAY
jgi:uncharacterized protein YdbL (DUF1318 family)